MSPFAYRLSTGWRTEDKRTGHGDIHETGSAYYFTLVAAATAMAQFADLCDAYSQDRGSYWAHACASIDELDAEGEVIGQPVASWQSKPAEVTP